MLQINVGDIGSRIANGLDIQGRIPVTLDETAVGTVQLIDLSQPLFSQNPAYFCDLAALTFAVTPVQVVIQNLRPTLTTIIDHIKIDNMVATAGIVQILLGRNQANLTLGGLVLGGVLNQPGPNTVAQQTTISQANQAGIPGSGTALWQVAIQGNIGADDDIPIGAVLYPNDALIISGANVAGSDMRAMIYGREYSIS